MVGRKGNIVRIEEKKTPQLYGNKETKKIKNAKEKEFLVCSAIKKEKNTISFHIL